MISEPAFHILVNLLSERLDAGRSITYDRFRRMHNRSALWPKGFTREDFEYLAYAVKQSHRPNPFAPRPIVVEECPR